MSSSRVVSVVALVALVALAAPAAAAPTSVQQDACGDEVTGTGTVLTGQDICEVVVETVRSGTDPVTGAAVPTSLSVTMAVVGDPTAAPSAHSVAWGAGDCQFVPFRSDGGGLSTSTGLSVACGERLDDCSVWVPTVCEPEYEFHAVHDAVAVEVGATSVTWTVTFDGELADYADVHEDGDAIRFGIALAGPSQPSSAAPIASFVCSSETGCNDDFVGDFADGGTTYTIGS